MRRWPDLRDSTIPPERRAATERRVAEALRVETTMGEPGRTGYEAYAASTGGKTYDGRDMPKWDELPQRIKDAWGAVEKAYLG